MAYPFNPDIKVSQAVYNNKEYIGIESLDNARRAGDPEVRDFLNSAILYAYGSNGQFGDRNFPILHQTQGMGKKRGIKSIDGLVRNHILGKPKRTSVVAITTHLPNAQTGKGKERFQIVFRDRYFMKNQILIIGGLANDSVHLHVYGDPVRDPKGWRYTVMLASGDHNAFVPYKWLTAGSIWAGGVVAVSLEHSRGTESRSYYPFQIKNYLNLIRQSINVAGNASNKYLNFKINVDGSTYEMVYQWEKYLTERHWNAKRDLDLVISKMTMDEDGIIQNVDADSGKPIYRGMGLWDQIPSSNTLTYSVMTENLFENWITDILSITDQVDRDPSEELVVDIMAGYGLMMEVDKALKRNQTLLTPLVNADLYTTKEADGSLTAGAYFRQYKHRSGVTFRFTSYAGFDKGDLAESSGRHPMYPNLPMSSFYGMIMNFGLVTNDSGKTVGNIEYLFEEGREYTEGTVRGMAPIEGKQGGEMATDIDASAMHMMVSQGVHVNYPMSLGKIICKAG